jgi:hypothetical protein
MHGLHRLWSPKNVGSRDPFGRSLADAVKQIQCLLAFVVFVLLSGCTKTQAPEAPATAPSPSPRPTPSIFISVSPRPSPSPSPETERDQASREMLKQSVSDQQALLSTLNAQLQARRAETAADLHALDVQGNEQTALRTQQMRDLASAIRDTEMSLTTLRSDLRNMVGPTGLTWDNEVLSGLEYEIATKQANVDTMRARYTAIEQEQTQMTEDNLTRRAQIAKAGQADEVALGAQIASAKAELDSLTEQAGTRP